APCAVVSHNRSSRASRCGGDDPAEPAVLFAGRARDDGERPGDASRHRPPGTGDAVPSLAARRSAVRLTGQRGAARDRRLLQSDLADAERQLAERALVLESAALRDFDRVYVCSEADRRALEARREAAAIGTVDRAAIALLPNALASPPAMLPPPPYDAPFTLL